MKKLFLYLSLILGNLLFSQEKYDVYFDFNKGIPNEKSLTALKQWMSENENAQILKMYGYCDSVDDNSYNKELALKRIQNTLQIITDANLKISKNVELIPFGKDFKRSTIQEENRRVTFFYDKIALPQNNVGNYEIPSEGDLVAKMQRKKNSLAAQFKKAKKGDIIKIDNIYFHLDSDKIIEKSKPILEELFVIMQNDPKLKIQIDGHICCYAEVNNGKLSSQRAIAVKAFLLEKEVLYNRIHSKGFGSTKPIFKIPEQTEKERFANRRVEIEIIDK